MATRKRATTISAETCLSCGACCVAPGRQNAFCDISKDDAERLGRKFVRLHVLQPSAFDVLASAFDRNPQPFGVIKTRWKEQKAGPFKGREFNTCHALSGSVLHNVSCSVYNRRPATCRNAVRPGDRQCRRLRAVFKKAAKRFQP